MRRPFFYFSLALLISCASSPKQVLDWGGGQKLDLSQSKVKWSKKLGGKVTELLTSRDGSMHVVSILKDKVPHLVLVTSQGKTKWEKKLDSTVEKIEFSQKSNWIVVSVTTGQFLSFDLEGKREWEKKGQCYPRIIEANNWLVCASFSEGDQTKQLRVLARNGDELTTHTFKKPVVDFAVSQDEQNLIVGVEGGTVWFYRTAQLNNSGARPFQRGTVNGEIMSLSIGSGLSPIAGVLFLPTKDVNYRGQRFALFDGKRKHEFLLKRHADGFDMKSDGSSVIFFGNGPQGQTLSYYSKNRAIDIDPNDYQQRWDVHRSHFADYSPNAMQVDDMIVFGVEEYRSKPAPYLLAINNDGKVIGALSIETSYGAYLYHAIQTTPNKLNFVIATDDGQLQSYELAVSDRI